METKTMYLTSTSILALLLAAQLVADETNMRYREQAGSYQLEVDQQILAGADYSHPAERTFSMTLDMQTQDQAVTTTLNKISGTYTAHEMTQRLSTRHLKGKSLELTSADGGRALAKNAREDDPRIGLGAVTPQGYPISMALSDMLPVLPVSRVEIGSNWTTESELNSLVGWGWINGKLVSLSMNEDAYAISKLPQGNVPVHQITTSTLSP
jgi:hypothetical protein